MQRGMSVRVDQEFPTHSVAVRGDERLAVALVAATAAFALAAFAPQLLNDGDTYLHIAAGTRMLMQHAISFRDPFSYTFAGAPWQAHEWLAEVVMAAAFKAGGWSGLVLLFATAAGAVSGLLAHHLGRWLDWRAQALAMVLALSCMTASLLARPHLLALPLLEIWTAELVLARRDRRAPTLWLLPVMVIWVNVHGTFFVGLGLCALLALEAVIAGEARRDELRAWAVFGAAALLAALCNPHFVTGLLFPVTLVGTTGLANVGEWRPLDLSHPQPLEFVLLATIYFAVTYGVRIPASRALMVLGLAHMALLHQRHQIIFAVVAPLLLAPALGENFARATATAARRPHFLAAGLSIGTLMLLMALAAGRMFLPVTRSDGPVAPISALERVPASLRSQPVLNDYSFGGYLIFKGVPTFIDSRAELFGDDFLHRYAQLIEPNPAAVKAVIRTYHIRWTILGAHSPIVSVMDSLAGWHRLYADDFAIVHIQDNYARKHD